MSDAPTQLDERPVLAATLGAPGALDSRRCAQLALAGLAEAAGPTLRLASLSLEMGSVRLEADDVLALAIATDRRTASIAFLSLEARVEGVVAFSARGVFSRQG